ncbi:MAG: thioredoxin domain-containing protein [Myxococcales bacterium]|nr:thioredoxin domain-containing protein [Myxococcales bacterium]HRC56369.1 thioredoxin domain-containing protein [Kofleriaceae bacterium]
MSKNTALASVLACALSLSAGCEKQGEVSRFGGITESAGAASSGAAEAGGTGGGGNTGNSSLESRVKRLEDESAKNAEAMAFLNQVWGQQKAQQEQEQAQTPAPDAVFAIDITGDPVDGPASAPVTLVKAYDFDCPYCEMANAPLKQLVKDYNGKLRVVYKNFVVHPQSATTAHLGGCAAWEQKKFMEFKDAFWEKGFKAARQSKDRSKMGEENVLAIAKEVGLNVDKFKADMNGDKCKQLIERDMAELSKFGTNATPSFYINGQPYRSGLETAAFKVVIDQKLKEAEASGVPGKDYYQKVVIEKGEKKFRSIKDPKPS